MNTYDVKKHFVSRFGDDGWLLEFDASQLEVAALAEITKDPVLIDELNKGLDIHTRNAGAWLGKDESLVTKEERKSAKVMTFQTLYGASVGKMAETLGIMPLEVESFLRAFRDKYLNVSAYFNLAATAAALARSKIEPVTKTITTIPIITGRKYTTKILYNEKFGSWGAPQTQLRNYPVQGFATGDLIPLIINMVNANLVGSTQILFVNTTHDSALYDVHKDATVWLLSYIEETFTSLKSVFKELFDYELKIDYTYEVKFGPNWSEMTELTRTEVQQLLEE